MNPITFIFLEFQSLPEVEAIVIEETTPVALSSTQSICHIYIFGNTQLSENDRNSILSQYCARREIKDSLEHCEDECLLDNGVDIDIIYQACNTNCNQTATSKQQNELSMLPEPQQYRVIYDRTGRFTHMNTV